MNNDEQLLAKAKTLDPEALRALHQQFYEPVARYISFKVGNAQTVEDLSGEVFVRVIEGLKRGKGWQESPKGWIMGIARNLVADYYRQRERVTEVKLTPDVAATQEASPIQLALRSERKAELMAAIHELTDDQRDVILMRFMEGINIEGVAKAIGKTPGAVKGLQYRALRALAEKMKEFSAEDRLELED